VADSNDSGTATLVAGITTSRALADGAVYTFNYSNRVDRRSQIGLAPILEMLGTVHDTSQYEVMVGSKQMHSLYVAVISGCCSLRTASWTYTF